MTGQIGLAFVIATLPRLLPRSQTAPGLTYAVLTVV
ncbi:hypothetical protein DR64_8451 [Paraburkholderia xenovorans LB400]|nr:hypothetical protein DR64_8451 [Paraburkholderia xenovorans LB400]